MSREKVSVIMGIYNCSDTVEEAIESILNQTYINWELIICDDCSTDDTYNIVQKYKIKYPEKIILLRNDKNSKLSYTLNKCLKHTTGYYIARMDGDDISAPNRFRKQVTFLENNTDIDLVGTSMRRFNKDKLADIVYSVKDPDRYTLKKRIPFYHATIMTYKYVYEKLEGYTVSERTERSQDYDLWFRFFYKDFRGDNLTEPLYLVRENEEAIKRRTFKVRFNAYKTTVMGFKLLNFPLHSYIIPTIETIFKSIVPSKVVLIYRKYQSLRFNKRN